MFLSRTHYKLLLYLWLGWTSVLWGLKPIQFLHPPLRKRYTKLQIQKDEFFYHEQNIISNTFKILMSEIPQRKIKNRTVVFIHCCHDSFIIFVLHILASYSLTTSLFDNTSVRCSRVRRKSLFSVFSRNSDLNFS